MNSNWDFIFIPLPVRILKDVELLFRWVFVWGGGGGGGGGVEVRPVWQINNFSQLIILVPIVKSVELTNSWSTSLWISMIFLGLNIYLKFCRFAVLNMVVHAPLTISSIESGNISIHLLKIWPFCTSPLTFKAPNKNCSRRHFIGFSFIFLRK